MDITNNYGFQMCIEVLNANFLIENGMEAIPLEIVAFLQ
jgi:hypothetical protein